MTTYEVGQTAIVTIDTPGGALDTTLALTVTSPDTATVTTTSATPNVDHTSWTLNLEVDEPGDWTIVAVAAGSGANESSLTLHVAPQPPPSPGAYATTADWAGWFGAPPDGVALSLRLAELDVKGKIRCALYDTDDDDLPTDTALLAALRNATVLQAKHRRDTGRASGASGGAGQFSLGKVSVGPRDASKILGGMPNDPLFSADAWQFLFDAGLTGWGPRSY